MFIDLIRSRRSIREYDNRPVEAEKIDLLVETALRAPTSKSSNPWSFIVVTAPELLTALSKAKPHGASFLAKAPLAFVVCADPGKSDVWVEDAAIATIFLQLAATDLGLGSCWIQLRKRTHDAEKTAGEYTAALLGLPSGMEVEAIMAIGYPLEKKRPHDLKDLAYDKIHWGRFGASR
jgi:nitroreductase